MGIISKYKGRAKKNLTKGYASAKSTFGKLREEAKEYQAKAPERRTAQIMQLKQEVQIAKLRKQKGKLMETSQANSYGSGLNKIL